jgi:hypothetical protein
MIPLTLVQLVVGLTIIGQPCPAYQLHFSCFVQPTTIYLTPEDNSVETLMHEEGHADDFTNQTPTTRRKFKIIMGYKPTRRWWDVKYSMNLFKHSDSEAPGEAYAENFMGCALDKPWKLKKLCKLLPPSDYAIWRLQTNLPKHK